MRQHTIIGYRRRKSGLSGERGVLVIGGLITAAFFTGALSGEVPEERVVPVMAQVSSETREELRPIDADPFGYHNGRWNLWEYLGDTLAGLFTGE